jgi:hypothetical protein
MNVLHPQARRTGRVSHYLGTSRFSRAPNGHFGFQRRLFRVWTVGLWAGIVTSVDVPLIPSFLLGMILAIINAFRPVPLACPESSLEMQP